MTQEFRPPGLLFAPRRKYSLLSWLEPWLNLKVMGLSKEAIEEPKKAFSQALRKAVKIRLAYKSSSPEAEIRLSKALSMLLTEGDILDYLRKSSGKREKLNEKEKSWCSY